MTNHQAKIIWRKQTEDNNTYQIIRVLRILNFLTVGLCSDVCIWTWTPFCSWGMHQLGSILFYRFLPSKDDIAFHQLCMDGILSQFSIQVQNLCCFCIIFLLLCSKWFGSFGSSWWNCFYVTDVLKWICWHLTLHMYGCDHSL